MGNTRYIWEKYNVEEIPGTNLKLSDPVKKYVVAFTGVLGDSDSPLLWAVPNFHDGSYYDESLGNTDVILCLDSSSIVIDVGDIIKEVDKSKIIPVRATVYYGLEDPSEDESYLTFETNSSIISIKAKDEFDDDIIDIVSVERSNDSDGNDRLCIEYSGTTLVDASIPIMGNNKIGYITSNREGDWPEDDTITSRDAWYHYIGSDEISVPQSRFTMSTNGISKNGGTVHVSFIPPVSNLDEVFTYTWYYSSNNGEKWIRYNSGTVDTSATFTVRGDSTGFVVAIEIDDGYGFKSDKNLSGTIYVLDNVPPTAPTFKVLPSAIVAGQQFNIEWNESSDDDGYVYGYVLEKSIGDSGTWTHVMTGIDRVAYDKIDNVDAGFVQYRLKAFDNEMLYSEATLSDKITVSKNTPPIISGSNVNYGIIDKFDESYTVSDPNDTVTVTEYFDNTVLDGSPYKLVEGVAHRIIFTDDTWKSISNGIHVVKIVAVDQYGAQAVRTWIFRKGSAAASEENLDRIKMYRKVNGSYRPVRFENDSANVVRPDNEFSVEESLIQHLPDSQPTDDSPTYINIGKIVVGRTKVFARTNDNNVIELQPLKPPFVANPTAPSDKTLFWIDTSDISNPLLRYWNGSRWQLIKSIYSGGTRDY